MPADDIVAERFRPDLRAVADAPDRPGSAARHAGAAMGCIGSGHDEVHALSITLIASVYIGFAVADGGPRIIVAGLFVVLAAVAVIGTPWLLAAVDWLVAIILIVEIAAGVNFRY